VRQPYTGKWQGFNCLSSTVGTSSPPPPPHRSSLPKRINTVQEVFKTHGLTHLCEFFFKEAHFFSVMNFTIAGPIRAQIFYYKTHTVKGKKVTLSLCLTKHRAMKAYWGSGGIVHSFFNLGTRWRRVVSFTPRPLYPQRKSPWYTFDRRLGGPQSRSGRGGEEKNSQPPPGIEP
jgi:hypothetical protein